MLAMLPASTLVLSCTPGPELYPPICRGGPADLERAGRYDASLEVCVVAADLQAACAQQLAWWSPVGEAARCPGFDAYARGTCPIGSPYSASRTWDAQLGCIGADGRSYDVVAYQDQSSQDFALISRAVFAADDGALVWLTYMYSQRDYEVCCVPDNKSGISEGWGTPVYEDCTNAKVYTPLDFPETGDTGVAQEPTDTSDTAAGDTGASDTSDTGSGA